MSHDPDVGRVEAEPAAAPVFRLPTLPRLESGAPRSSEPLPAAPMLTLEGARAAQASAFQEMLQAQQHDDHARRRARRPRRGSSGLVSFVVMLLIGGALAYGGYAAYQEYERREAGDGLPTFEQIEVAHQSFTIVLTAEESVDSGPTVADPDPVPNPMSIDPTAADAPAMTRTTTIRATTGRGSNTLEVVATIVDPLDPLGNGSVTALVDKRGMFVQAPDGSWVLFTDPGDASYDRVAPYVQLVTWNDLVPDEMRPHIELVATTAGRNDHGPLTTYDLILDLHGFATADPRAFEAWNDDLQLHDGAVDDMNRRGYQLTVSVDDDGLVWSWRSDDTTEQVSIELVEVSDEVFAPALPTAWTEMATGV